MKRVAFLMIVALAAFALLGQPALVFGQAPTMGKQAPAAAAPAAPTDFPGAYKASFQGITRYLSASAEKMPEEYYGFKPTPEVRSFGEIIGHLANSQFSYCSTVKGEKNPNTQDFEKTKTKADLVKALADSNTYCATLYNGLTTADAFSPIKVGERTTTAGRTLLQNITHDWEHYGNLVTYLRLKNIVPPSSEPRR